jgi:pilus assembly protein CpaB
MKMKSAVLLAFALCSGLVAMLGVQQIASQQRVVTQVKVKVLVAAANLEAGVPLNETNVKFIETPEEAVRPGAITKVDQYEERALIVPVMEGDMILTSKLGEKGQMGASMAVPVGYRLISLPVTDTKTNSGQLRPSDRVDILITYKNKENFMTKTLLEYIEVFSIDSFRTVDSSNREIKTKNVALLLTPEQTQIVRLAGSLGELDLTLRNKNDTEIVNTPEVIDSLLKDINGTVNGPKKKSTYSPPAQEMVKTEAPVAPVVPQNKDSIQDFLKGLTMGTGSKEPQPPQIWNVMVFNGEEVSSVEFEKHGKGKDSWKPKMDIVPDMNGNQAANVNANAMTPAPGGMPWNTGSNINPGSDNNGMNPAQPGIPLPPPPGSDQLNDELKPLMDGMGIDSSDSGQQTNDSIHARMNNLME